MKGARRSSGCAALLVAVLVLAAPSCGALGEEPAAAPEAAAHRPTDAAAATEGAGRFGTGASLPRLVVVDLREVLAAPVDWKGPEWRRFALAIAGVGGAALLDGTVRKADGRLHSRFADHLADAAEPLGSTDSFAVLGLFYAGGVAADDVRARSTAVDGLLAAAFAGGVSSAVKTVVGRKRPHDTAKTFDFAPLSSNASFPSGHATQAFAVAAAIATHYDSAWIKGLSYGSAALVGFARIHHQAHFLSDVTAGAILGAAVGRSVVHHNQRQRSRHALMPMVGPRGQPGVGMALSF